MIMEKKNYITPSLKALDAADEQLMQQASLPVVTPETGGETVDPGDMLSRKHYSVWDEEEE